MEEFKYIITQEEVNAHPLGMFKGIIHLPANSEEADGFAKKLLTEKVIGFDTESRPSFKKGQYFPVSLIQLSTESEAYLFRIAKTGIPSHLKILFESDTVAKVGVGLKQDLNEMKAKGIECTNFIDLEKIAATHKFKQRGIRALAAYFLKLRISKSAQKSNWSREKLTQAQINYAATDAWVCLKIYNEMIKAGFVK
jgi:ribonuclease D